MRGDPSIKAFSYLFLEHPVRVQLESQKETYKLVGNEPEVAPNSTLSDWNRNGLRRLLEIVAARESYLAQILAKPPVIKRDEQTAENSDSVNVVKNRIAFSKKRKKKILWWTFLFLAVILAGITVGGWIKGRQIYHSALLVRQDAVEIQKSAKSSSPPLDRVRSAVESLSRLTT